MGVYDSAVLPSFSVEDEEEEQSEELVVKDDPVAPAVQGEQETTSSGSYKGAILPPTNMNNVLNTIQSTTEEQPSDATPSAKGAVLPSVEFIPNESTLNEVQNPDEIPDEDIYGNEDSPDMFFNPLVPEFLEEEVVPTIKNNFVESIREQLKDDPTSPYLQGLLDKEIKVDARAKQTYQANMDSLYSKESLNILREKAVATLNRRDARLEQFREVAEKAGFNSPLEYLRSKAKSDPQSDYGTLYEEFDIQRAGISIAEYVKQFDGPATVQDFFDEEVYAAEADLQNDLTTIYGYLNGENPAHKKGVSFMLDRGLSLNAIANITEGRNWVDPTITFNDFITESNRAQRELDEIISGEIPTEEDHNRLVYAFKSGNVGDFAAATAMATLNLVSVIPAVKVVTKGLKKAKGWIEDPSVVMPARTAGGLREQKLRDAVKAKVAENNSVKEELLTQFENKFDVTITKMVDGKRVIDRDAVKVLGERKTLDLMESETNNIINLPSDALTAPILNAETMDSLVGTLIDLKKIAPEEFGKSKTLIDDMLRITIEGKVKPEKMMDILAENGMQLEEFVLATYGSVSKAGEVLGRFSHLQRVKPKGILEDLDSRVSEKADSKIKDYYNRYFLRTEGLRKGILVSPLAVAMRNMQSNFVRAPMESLNAVISNAVWKASNEGSIPALKSLNPFSTESSFKNGMDNLRLMFKDVREAKHFSEYVLQHSPDHARMMYNTLNEMQLNMGRGQATSAPGRVADEMYSMLEDFSGALNTPNRIQELNIRNATFWSELKRLVKNEYKVDLKDSLDGGMLMDFVRDSSTVKPAGARSFVALMDDATRKAMRVTYSATPENYILRKTANFISKSPLSIAIPFPKFIANGIEYFAEGTMGAAGPIKRKLQAQFFDRSLKGPLTARESEKIANNIIGLGVFTGLYQWQKDENRGKDYQNIGIPLTDLDANIVGTYPMAQMNWIARAAVERDNGTFDMWDAKDEWLELFFGMQQRAGVSNVITDELTSMLSGAANETDAAKRDKIFGRVFGQYVTGFLNPYFQVIELERDMGIRTTERKEAGKDFIITDNQFLNETKRSLMQRGGLDPEEEALLPKRETVTDTNEKRQYIKSRVFAGITVKERNETIQYLQEIGITDPNYTLGSKHKMKTVQNYQNEKVSSYWPSLVAQGRRTGERAEMRWQKSKELQDKYTLAAYMRMYERGYIQQQVRDIRKSVGEGKALIDTPVAKRTDQYIALPKDVRRIAEAEWVRLYSRKSKDGVIDFSNLKHLTQLLALAGVDLKPK